MLGVFIYELILNSRQQGSPISLKVCDHIHRFRAHAQTTQPFINPMLGPSGSALINLGARFPPCMKNVADVPITLSIACKLIHLLDSFARPKADHTPSQGMNNTQNPISEVCTVGDLCGFGGQSRLVTPYQTRCSCTSRYPLRTRAQSVVPVSPTSNDESIERLIVCLRFIVPIFLHAGIIHFLMNMLAQLSLSSQVSLVNRRKAPASQIHLRSNEKWALEGSWWSTSPQGYSGKLHGALKSG